MESNKLTNVILDGKYDVFEWGWYVEPDPDSMLSYMTCDQRGNWSDSWYCNEEYDALYDAAERRAGRREARVEMVKQMQQMLYEDSPYLVTAYNTDRRGVPQRPVRLLPAAARPRRHLADPVRRRQLPQRAAGGRGGRLRRRRDRARCQPATSRGGGADDGGSTVLLVGGGVVLVAARRRRRSGRDAAPGDGGRPRVTRSQRSPAAAAARLPRPARGRRRRRELRPLRPRQVRSGALGSLVFVLVVELLPVPGAARRPGPDAGPRTVQDRGAAGGVHGRVRPRPAAAAAVPHLPEEHAEGRPRGLAALPACRSRS